jgi:hypothetical protein
MRRLVLALPLVGFSVGWLSIQAIAQETKHTRGTLTAINPDSVTIKVANADMKFTYDDKTRVEAPGGGTKARQQEQAGKAGVKLADLLTTGQAVEVSYHDLGGALHATLIKQVSSPGSGGVPPKTSNGSVTAVSPTSLTISGSGGGGSTFTQTYVIDSKTKVVGKGIGTKAAPKGGKMPITDLIHNGDTVSVSYSEQGSGLHADEIRVTAAATR